MEQKINELLNEGGKIIERNSEFCIVEQNGKYSACNL